MEDNYSASKPLFASGPPPGGPPGGGGDHPGQYRIVRALTDPANALDITKKQQELELLEQQGFTWLAAADGWIYLYKELKRK